MGFQGVEIVIFFECLVAIHNRFVGQFREMGHVPANLREVDLN